MSDGGSTAVRDRGTWPVGSDCDSDRGSEWGLGAMPSRPPSEMPDHAANEMPSASAIHRDASHASDASNARRASIVRFVTPTALLSSILEPGQLVSVLPGLLVAPFSEPGGAVAWGRWEAVGGRSRPEARSGAGSREQAAGSRQQMAGSK